jgi:pimeloyl-ACP methyl ester carboxylesterase
MAGQFRTLLHHFFVQFFDTDTDDVPYARVLQLVAILTVPGLLISFFLIPDHPKGSLIMAGAETEAERVWLRVGDRYVFVAYAMSVMGLLMAFKWDSLFPDRKDYLILTSLPITLRRWFAAKIAALSAFLSLFLIAINLFSLLIIPAVIAGRVGGGWNVLRQAIWAHASGTIGGSIFAALFFVALQGVLINILPARIFRRLSPFVQTISIFVLLTLLLVTPLIKESIPPLAKADSALLYYFPFMWFLGMYESMLPGGTLIPQSAEWARCAMTATALLFVVAGFCYWCGYHRYSKKALEESEHDQPLTCSFRVAVARFTDRLFLQNGIQRGTFHFIDQISRRSSEHRKLTALYCAIGAALAMSSLFVLDSNSAATVPFRVSSTGSLEASLIFTFVLIAGLRATFNVAYDVDSNWVFQIVGTGSAPFLNGVRKWILVHRVIPLVLLFALFECCSNPPVTALCHVLFDLCVAILLLEAFFLNSNKVPFTCSRTPNKLQMVVMGAAYLYGFTIYVQVAGGFKGFVTSTPALHLARLGRMSLLLCFSTVTLFNLRKYRTPAQITFSNNYASFNAISSGEACGHSSQIEAKRSYPRRPSLKTIFVWFLSAGAAIVLAGIAFERTGEILDRRAFPQVGRSYDVGERSLNISCLGTGSPAVVLESDFAVAGYSWLMAQRQIAKSSTACWYDRAGYGWSDAGPFPNHSDSVAQDLHTLLKAANLSPPYIIVGHGVGGFHVRVYNGLYPNDAVGLILVDPMNEDTTIHVHNHDENLRPAIIQLMKLLSFAGILRLTAPGPGIIPDGWSSSEWTTATAMAWQPKSGVAHLNEPPLWINGELARRSGHLDQIPLIVLSGEKHFPLFAGQNVELELARHDSLARQSIRGTHRVVANSGYWNPYKTPRAVVDSAQDLIKTARTLSDRNSSR